MELLNDLIIYALIEGVCNVLANSKLPHRFWVEALSTCMYFRNSNPTRAPDGITPYEYDNFKPDVNLFCIFGCSTVRMLMFLKLRGTSLIQKQGNVSCWAMAQSERLYTIFMILNTSKLFIALYIDIAFDKTSIPDCSKVLKLMRSQVLSILQHTTL